MHIFYALAAAVGWGSADFVGGHLSRRNNAYAVVLLAQLFGLLPAVIALLLIGGEPTTRDLIYGLAAGVVGGAAAGFFYLAMSRGRIGIVAPVTGAATAATPLVFGFIRGERPSGLALIGVALAIVAIVFVSSSPSTGKKSDSHVSLADGQLWLALACGVGFGLFNSMLSLPRPEAGLWPTIPVRIGAGIEVAAIGLAIGGRMLVERSSLRMIFLLGCFDAGAVTCLQLAVHSGPLTVVAVLAAMYPAVTVTLAGVVLHERWHGKQLLGLVIALMAIPLVARG